MKNSDIVWEDTSQERYCVDTGYPTSFIDGDRCRAHIGSYTKCYVAVRDPRCKHVRVLKHYPEPYRCGECGRIGRRAQAMEVVFDDGTSSQTDL